MNTGLKVVIAILCLIVISFAGLGLKVLLFPVNTFVKSVDTAYGVVDKTLNADNAIYNYEWFKTQEAYIRQCLRNEQIADEELKNYVAMLPGEREKWTREDKQEEASLRNSYYALQKLTNKAMEDYNARTSMANRVIFKDNLPSNISRAWYAGKQLIN